MKNALWIYAAVLAAACGGDTADDDDDDDAAVDCAVELQPGSDDQTAVQEALVGAVAGDIVCFAAGTFAFTGELSLTVGGVTLHGAGRERTILDFSAQTSGANGVLITGDGVIVEDLQVLDTVGDGIRAEGVAGITFRDLSVLWTTEASADNGAYGLYPVGSDEVVIERVLVDGASDAGIYVGQSTNVIIRDSEARGNVAGIEVENTTDAEVFGNHAHDNTGGILVFNLPSLPVQDGKRANVHDNLVENNNLDNFADAGSIVASVPPGTGILVLASDRNEIHANTVHGNDTAGIILVSYQDFVFGTYHDDAFDPFPQGNDVHDNDFADNGGDPRGDLAASIPLPDPVPDMLWDGCTDAAAVAAEQQNCMHDNGAATFFNFDLCHGFANQTDDLGPVTCTQEPLR